VDIGPARAGYRYDLVLVDAPCSGTGVLRRHPENRWKLRFPVDAQRELLARARTLAPRVVYATCSLARRENEDLVRAVAGEPLRETTSWPADGAGEGFYWAEVAGG
jgi:16S rRNA (cytosine967-C5)-methyltransferase